MSVPFANLGLCQRFCEQDSVEATETAQEQVPRIFAPFDRQAGSRIRYLKVVVRTYGRAVVAHMQYILYIRRIKYYEFRVVVRFSGSSS